MADNGKTPRKWSLEEIDELLQDSGMLPRDGDIEAVEEVAPTPKEPTFNPRPAHNEKIKHRIIKEQVERSEGTIEPQVYGNFVSEKYRDRFFNKPIQNIEKTAEHSIVPPEAQKYERGGFVKKKSNFTNTTDFSPVPNLVPDDKIESDLDEGKTIVIDDKTHTKTIALRSLAVTDGDAHDVEIPQDEEDMQLSFEGFNVEEKNIVDEKTIEQELIKKRKSKVDSFTITSDTSSSAPTEESKKYGTDEYRTSDDKYKVQYYLKKKKSSALVGSIVSYVCAFILLCLSIASGVMPEGGKIILILSLVFTVIPTIFNINFIIDGVKAFKGFNFNRNSGCFIAILATIIQQIVLFTSDAPFENGVSLFSASAIFALALNMSGEYFELKRISQNFKFLISREEVYSIGNIEKTETAFEIGRGLLLQDPAVLSSQKTLFPRRFIELSRSSYPSDEIIKKLLPIGFGVSLLIGAITLLISKDVRNAVTAFSGAICVSIPYFSYIVDSFAISKTSKKLRKNGAMIAGWDSFKLCDNANAIAVDSADVFDEKGGNVYGIHQFYDIQIDEAIIYTATLLIASGGPLGNLFKRVIVGETSLLPPVDTLAYEDKLGLSAWIFNRRILVGNSDLLRNHNVEIPDTALIEKHLCEGRYPLYLAIDGKAAAVFIVSYDINGENAKLLKKIENHSISLLVRSDDANITDEMVSRKLNLPQSGVKVLSAVSGDLYKSYVKETTSAADSLLLHDGKAHSFLYAIKNSLSLGAFKQVLNTFQISAMGLGVAMVAAMSFVSGLQYLTCFSLILIQAIFTGLSLFAVSGSSFVKSFEKKSFKGKKLKKKK